MKKVDLIVFAGWVLPIAPQNKVLKDHAIAVSDGEIIEISPALEIENKYQARTFVRLPGHVVLPSFINTHTHLAMSYFRGLGDDLPFMSWLKDYVWPAESATVSVDFVNDATRHAVVECIRSGVSCVNDHYFFENEVANILSSVGLKGLVSNCIFNFGTPWAESAEVCFEQSLSLQRHTAAMKSIHAALGPHSPYGTDDEIMARCAELSKNHQLKIHIHLHESRAEIENFTEIHGMSPIQYYDSKGWLNKCFIAVHAVHLSDEDIDILAKSGASVVHCPESNMKIGNGIAPIQKLLDRGVNVALGTDGAASNNDLDMIGEMRSAAFLAKVSTEDSTHLSAETVLEMATINGARALGLEQTIGSLERGKSADFIAIDLNRAETLPVYNPISQIVYAACREQVTDMWVSGKPIMRNRCLLSICEQEVLQRQLIWQNKVQEAVASN